MKRLARCMSAILVIAVSLAVLTACITVRVGPKSDGPADGKGNRPGKVSDCPYISEVRNADGTIVTTYRILDDTLVFKENPADNTATIDSSDADDYFDLPDKISLKKGADGSYTGTDDDDNTYTVSKGNDGSLNLKYGYYGDEYVAYAMVPDRDDALTISTLYCGEEPYEIIIATDGWGYLLDPDNGGYVVLGTVNRDAAQLTIPSEFRGVALTGIEGGAFSGCESLSSVTIPDSVESIGSSAFSDTPWYDNQPDGVVYAGKVAYKYKGEMPGNKKIELKPDTKGIGDSAFCYCGNLSLITIPASVTSIGDEAFRDCVSLASITIPSSVTSIGDSAFSGCTSLASVTIPDSVESVGSSAFRYTPWYGNLPDGLIYIGSVAYNYKGEMPENKKIELKTGTKTINSDAFRDCDNLASITLPSGVTSIGSSAFSGCTSLTSITIPSGVKSIGDDAFYRCRSLTSIDIPGSVTNIAPENPFSGCGSLAHITVNSANKAYRSEGNCLIEKKTNKLLAGCKASVIPSSVASIGGCAFYGCEKLTSITIPAGVTSIGGAAFGECTSLASVIIPDSVTDIGGDAFGECTSLASVIIPDSVTNIGADAFYGTPWYNNQPDGLIYIGSVAYEYRGGMPENTKIELKPGTKTIGICAFYDCGNLTSVTIPNSVTHIKESAFSDCTGLTSVTIPDSVTRIGDGAFDDCTSLTSITISSGVTSIGSSAFSGCTSLTSIDIPGSVTNIEGHPFLGCSSLAHITVNSANTAYRSEGNCLIERETNTLIAGCKASAIPSSVISIAGRAFEGCTSLASITIPSSVTSIGWGAFYGCTSLASITIPSSVTRIEGSAFSGCTSLASITIPSSVTSIEGEAFSGTPWYGNLPDGLIYIGSVAYEYRGGMPENTSIELKEGTTAIASVAFYDFSGCSSLASITIPSSVTHIGEGAFCDCTSLEDIVFSGTKEQWEAIGKDYCWNCGVSATVLHCSDGDVSIEEE